MSRVKKGSSVSGEGIEHSELTLAQAMDYCMGPGLCPPFLRSWDDWVAVTTVMIFSYPQSLPSNSPSFPSPISRFPYPEVGINAGPRTSERRYLIPLFFYSTTNFRCDHEQKETVSHHSIEWADSEGNFERILGPTDKISLTQGQLCISCVLFIGKRYCSLSSLVLLFSSQTVFSFPLWCGFFIFFKINFIRI